MSGTIDMSKAIIAPNKEYTVEYNGTVYKTDENGFLTDMSQWDRNWIEYVCEQDNIMEYTLTHKRVIEFIRKYYETNDLAPLVRVVLKHTGVSVQELYTLFPSGPGASACRMAGIPKPRGCV